jgi:hypothetical protein
VLEQLKVTMMQSKNKQRSSVIPHLRLYVMHAGWPFLDEMMELLHAYPSVYRRCRCDRLDAATAGVSQVSRSID